MASEIIGLIPP